MSTYGEYEPIEPLEPNPLGGEVLRARKGAEQGFVIKTLTDAGLPPAQARRRVEVFLAQARLQKETAGEGGNGWAPIFLSGKDGESGAFYVTRFYLRSLQWLINSRRRLRPQETKNIALGIVVALSHLNRAHGNLRPTNILLDNPAELAATHVALTDPSERGDDLMADFYSLGQMLYHLVTGREFKAGDWKQSNAHFWKWPYDGINGQWALFIRRLLAGDVDADIEKLQRDIQKLPFIHNWPRVVAVLVTITVVSTLAVWIGVGMVARQRAAKQWNEQRPWLELVRSIQEGDRPAVLQFMRFNGELATRLQEDAQFADKRPEREEDRQRVAQDVGAMRSALEQNHSTDAALLQGMAADLPLGLAQQQLSTWADSFQNIDTPSDPNLLSEYWTVAPSRGAFDKFRDNRAKLLRFSPQLVQYLDDHSHFSSTASAVDATSAVGAWNDLYQKFDDAVTVDSLVSAKNIAELRTAVVQNLSKSLEDIEDAIANLKGLPVDTRPQWAQGINEQLSDLENQAGKLKESKAEAQGKIAGLREELAQYQKQNWSTVWKYDKKRRHDLESSIGDLQKRLADQIAAQIEASKLGNVNLQDSQVRAYWTTLPKAGQLAAIRWIVPLDESIQKLRRFAGRQYPDLNGMPQHLLAAKEEAEIKTALTIHVLNTKACQDFYVQLQTFSDNLENMLVRFRHGEPVGPQSPLTRQWAQIKHDPLFPVAQQDQYAGHAITEFDSAAGAGAAQLQSPDPLVALAAWRASKPAPGDLQQLEADAQAAARLIKTTNLPREEFIKQVRGFWVQALSAAPAHYHDVLAAYEMKSDCFVGDDAVAQQLLSPALWYNVQLARLQQGVEGPLSDDDKTKLANKVLAAAPAGADVSRLKEVLDNPHPSVSPDVKSEPEMGNPLLEKDKKHSTAEVQIFTWNLSRGDPRDLHFIRVHSNSGGDVYVAQTEVSVGLFIKMLQNGVRPPHPTASWDKVLSLMAAPHNPPPLLSDGNDDRDGARAWELTSDNPGDLQPAKYWLKDINVDPMPPAKQFYLPALRKDKQQSPAPDQGRDLDPQHGDGGFGAPGDDPDESFPVQQVSARLALYWAGMIGCRFPTVEEWKAALERTINSPALPDSLSQWKTAMQKIHPHPHLRGQLWCDEWNYLKQNSSTVARGAGPDASIFLPSTMLDDHKPNPLADDTDHIFWFKRVPPGDSATRGLEQFDDLVGNVAEFVLNDASAFDAPNQSRDPKVLSQLVDVEHLKNNVSVIGGSALSVSADVATPAAVKDLDQPFSDVGIRLAFKAPQVSYADQLADAARSLHYQTPSR